MDKDNPTADNLAASLLSNLSEILELHLHLKLVLNKELAMPASCSADEVEAIQKRKMEIAALISDQEQKRQSIVKECAAFFQLSEAPKLAVLATYFSEKIKEQLQNIHVGLQQAIDDIIELTKNTSRIAKARLISITTTVNQLDRWMAIHTFYSRIGFIKNKGHTRLVSRHI